MADSVSIRCGTQPKPNAYEALPRQQADLSEKIVTERFASSFTSTKGARYTARLFLRKMYTFVQIAN